MVKLEIGEQLYIFESERNLMEFINKNMKSGKLEKVKFVHKK